jgi:hypothetical protein
VNNDRRYEIAKEYVDKQLETMKEFGSAPREMSKEEYKALIDDVAETVVTHPAKVAQTA